MEATQETQEKKGKHGPNLRVNFKNEGNWLHIPGCEKYEANQNSEWVRVFREGVEIATISAHEVKSIYWTEKGSPEEERKKKVEQEAKERAAAEPKRKKFLGMF